MGMPTSSGNIDTVDIGARDRALESDTGSDGIKMKTRAPKRAAELRQQITRKEEELRALRDELARILERSDELVCGIEDIKNGGKQMNSEVNVAKISHPKDMERMTWKWPLREDEYARYARQLILPAVGLQGQLRLRATSALIVGAGGLGCPAAAYLAGAGVGILGLVDGDTVEVSNLHRQTAHSSATVGQLKVDSLAAFCRERNPDVRCVTYATHLTAENAAQVLLKYDVVLDCTDHPTSRYLISDACVLLQKPLVSASALRMDGQLIVLNHPAQPQGDPNGGPCYRCVFPKPPPAESVVSCGEGGILGPVVGVMGVLQALETIRVITGGASVVPQEKSKTPTMVLFSAAGALGFRSMRMRGRRADCFACARASKLSTEGLASGAVDYVQFCGMVQPMNILEQEERLGPMEYQQKRINSDWRHVLIDVRERELFELGSIPGAVNVPFSILQSGQFRAPEDDDGIGHDSRLLGDLEVNADSSICLVCRLGNDSQMVGHQLKQMRFGRDKVGPRCVYDIRGGMKAWKEEVDRTMPFI